MWCIMIEDNTELIKVSRPAWLSSFPFQLGNLAATLSMRICWSSLQILPVLNGSPRYRHGKVARVAYNGLRIVGKSVPIHLIGKT
jgi:hypothetical protein